MKLNFYILLLCLSSIGITSWGRNATPTSHLTVLQLNIWHEGSIVEGGFEAIADEVAQVDADIVFFSEVRNYNGTFFISRIIEALKKRGKTYYGEHNPLDVGILSKGQRLRLYPESNYRHSRTYYCRLFRPLRL